MNLVYYSYIMKTSCGTNHTANQSVVYPTARIQRNYAMFNALKKVRWNLSVTVRREDLRSMKEHFFNNPEYRDLADKELVRIALMDAAKDK